MGTSRRTSRGASQPAGNTDRAASPVGSNTNSVKTARSTRDNERPLVEDIRLLGRLLGDVIREQDGVAAYELIEQVRKLSVAFRRDADHEADKALKKLLKGLSSDQTVSVIRAFTYFSHLANLAEDRHHMRRRAVHERAGDTQEGSIDVALARLRWAGIAPKGHRQFAHLLNQLVGRHAVLLANHIAQQSPEQADVFHQRPLVVPGAARGFGAAGVCVGRAGGAICGVGGLACAPGRASGSSHVDPR